MAPTPPPGNENGLSTHLLAFLASSAGYLRSRMELAGIEGKEALVHGVKLVLCLLGGLLLLASGYVFLWVGLVTLLAFVVNLHWAWILLIIASAHLLVALACALGVRHLLKKRLFVSTLEELKHDEEWLHQQSGPVSQP